MSFAVIIRRLDLEQPGAIAWATAAAYGMNSQMATYRPRSRHHDAGRKGNVSEIFLLHRGDVFGSQNPKDGTIFASPPVGRHPREGCVVLNNLSKEIRECFRHAEDCAQQAAAQTDPQLKQDFLDLEQHWLFLACSYECTEQLTDLTDETKRQVDNLPKPSHWQKARR
jgi:hypothetical protein